MEDVNRRKKMRMQLKNRETQHVHQVDSSDPGAAFTSGPYGHGSRVFAKVVETVVARLERRLTESGGEGAAAAAVAGKVDKAWREMYKRPLPSEANVEDELKKRSLRAAPLSQGRGTVGPASAAAKTGSEGIAASSDLWYAAEPITAAARPRAAPPARKKRRGSAAAPAAPAAAAAAAAAAARKPKRRFVLKAALASGAGTRPAISGTQSAAGRRRRRPDDEAAVEKEGRRRIDGAARGRNERPVNAVGGSVVRTLPGAAPAPAAFALTRAGVPGGAECSNGGSGGGRGGGGGHATAGGGSGAEFRKGGAADDPLVQPMPVTAAAAAAATAAPQPAGGESVNSTSQPGSNNGPGMGTGEDDPQSAPSGTAGAAAAAAAGDSVQQAADESILEAAAEASSRSDGGCGGVESLGVGAGAGNQGSGSAEEGGGAEKIGNGDGGPGDLLKSASSAVAPEEPGPESAAADGGEATAAAPDVVVTANFVGKFMKENRRRTWRLDLEGGAIEGREQVFVFDECECWLQPPG